MRKDMPGVASMRPPEFTGGNPAHGCVRVVGADASMRPPEFTGGNSSYVKPRFELFYVLQ